METATFEEFSKAYDVLKSGAGCALTNIFKFGNELQKTLVRKKCLMHSMQDSIFLLVPTHDIYYECFFVASDNESLGNGLKEIVSSSEHDLCCSLIGKEPKTGELTKVFEDIGFEKVKKLLRIRFKKSNPKQLEAMRIFYDEYKNDISFAKNEDADEILEILLDTFDPVGDNIPDIVDIRDHIIKKHIIVLRQYGKIVSLHFFDVIGNVMHSIYDVTREEYRGASGFHLAIAFFIHEYFLSNGITYGRVLGWQDASNTKLIKHNKKGNKLWDGIVIYNMLHKLDPEHSVCADDNS